MSTCLPDDKDVTCLPWRVGYTKLEADQSSPHRITGRTSNFKQRSSRIWSFVFSSSASKYIEKTAPQSMSQPRAPYEPSHHSRQQSGVPSAGEMAQIQRPPSFPSAGFLSHSDQRPVPGPQLPPLLGLPAQHAAVGGNARHMQLPPMEPSPTVSEQTRHQGGRLPVSHLLSDNGPPSPKRASYGAPHSANAGPTVYRSSPDSRTSPNTLPYQRPAYQPPVQQHRLDQPPTCYANQYQPQHPGPHGPPAPPAPQQYVPPPPGPRVEPAYSPTPTTYSTPSCYDSQNEMSPATTAPPNSFSRVSQLPPLNYTLTIRQQPVAARACGFGERDRRVIDPPPILELKITDKATGGPEQDHNGMLALHCTLLNPANQEDETQAPSTTTDMQSTRRLMGTLVASPYQAKDERGIAGTFFVFPDLSCRAPGRYRLHFKLLRIDPFNMQQGAIHGTVASIITDVFNVYTAKDFPGMRASSALLKALRRQGLNVGVKKGSEARRGKGGRMKKEDASSSDEDDSDGSGDERGGVARRIESGPAPDAALNAKKLNGAAGAKKKRRRNS
jgi:hypothetical protein